MQTSPRSAMAPSTFLRILFVHGAAVGIGALIASACITVNYPSVAFRCNPRLDDACPEEYLCCSDDPSDFFSGANNNQSRRGMCVKEDGFIVESDPLNVGCPIPCNPTWNQQDINSGCAPTGVATQQYVCCQTTPLTEKDCVLDPELGTAGAGGVWRPVLVTDATGGSLVTPPSMWLPSQHDTHQDPGGSVCRTWPNADECIATLTVANQRGFCFPATVGCPAGDPAYVDACDERNALEGRPSWKSV